MASPRRKGQFWTSAFPVVAGGALLISVYLLLLNWRPLTQWADSLLQHH